MVLRKEQSRNISHCLHSLGSLPGEILAQSWETQQAKLDCKHRSSITVQFPNPGALNQGSGYKQWKHLCFAFPEKKFIGRISDNS